MKIYEINYQGCMQESPAWLPENIIEVDKRFLVKISDKICSKGECRYPLLALRILIHAITCIDNTGRVHISARQLSKVLDVNYDTVTKCLKYLRGIGVLQVDR